jgi:hypothetical protein
MSNLSIFNQELPDFLRESQGLNELTKALAGSGNSNKRISIRGGVFRKVVGGEEVGKLTNREMNVIIVNARKNVSRVFYAGKYNADEIVPPTCWSNDGDVPDPAVEDKQGTHCATCPQNVAGSGDNGSRACRYQRRIAILLEGDMSGDVYQLTLPSKSIFGKGEDKLHPFESYVKFVAGNSFNIDQIVTQVSMDTDSDTAKLFFSPVRHITKEEWEVVKEAGQSQAAKNAITMTVAQSDGVKKPIALPGKPVLNEEFEEPPAAPAVKAKAKQVEAEVEDVEIVEPVKRTTKKTETAAPAAKADLADVINAWSDA